MDILQLVVKLTPENQTRLKGALQAVSREVWSGPPTHASELPPQEQGSSEEDEAASFLSWMEDLTKEPIRVQMQKLALAIEEEEVPEFEKMMQERLTLLKNRNKRLTVELAVFDYAYQHPFMSLIALGGVGAGLYKLAKGGFNLIF